MDKIGNPVLSIPLDRWIEKEAKIKAQADEIERLRAERDKAHDIERRALDLLHKQDAQLATMRSLTTDAYDKLVYGDREACLNLLRQALATDAGKAAADVLAQAAEVEQFHRLHNDPGRTMSDADWRKGMDERIVKLRGFVDAYRKEGQDDG